METIVMPRLSDSMQEGTIVAWLKTDGENVARGEELVEIETDKASMAYESDFAGCVHHLVAAGETVAVGEPIAGISVPNQAAADTSTRSTTMPESLGGPELAPWARRSSVGAAYAPSESPLGPASQPYPNVSPVARRMASRVGLDLRQIVGSGPGGRIVKADVEAVTRARDAAADIDGTPDNDRRPAGSDDGETSAATEDTCAPTARGDVTSVELARAQSIVSQRMSESKAATPDFQLAVEVDMRACVHLRDQLKRLADPAPSFNDMVVKAAAIALSEFPRVNGSYLDGRWQLYSRVNIGIAVATADSLVVPTLFDADQKPLRTIARDARRIIGAVRAGSITPPELAGGTFTISNLGMHGIDWFTGIINPPQAAILAVGALKPKAVVDEHGQVVGRESMTINLICDHRILYGADGAHFLTRLRLLLEQPLSLVA